MPRFWPVELCNACHTVSAVAGIAKSSVPIASVMALMTATRRRDRAGLAAAFDAERVRWRFRRGHIDL